MKEIISELPIFWMFAGSIAVSAVILMVVIRILHGIFKEFIDFLKELFK